MSDRENNAPILIPEDPFDYVGLITNDSGMGWIPPEKYGTKIAIIGAGCAGLCAAYELMRIGLHPVVYESAQDPGGGGSRIGGRTFTHHFPGDNQAIAEIGAMRVPVKCHRVATTYMDQFSIDYQQLFPDPLTVPTVLFFDGERTFIDVKNGSPQFETSQPLHCLIEKVQDQWQELITPMKCELERAGSTVERQIKWGKFVDHYSNKSFYTVLVESGWNDADIELLGKIGIGTGGFDSLFPVSFLEILRMVVCEWERDQRLVKGGVSLIPMNFWQRQRRCVHWEIRSLEDLHRQQDLDRTGPLPGVTEISIVPDTERVKVTTSESSEEYECVIVTCSTRALEIGIKVDPKIFSQEVWTAIRKVHMMPSGKVFIRTRTAFWKNQEPNSAGSLHCTLTDLPIRQVYLFDPSDGFTSGVICLSYAWGDSAIKFSALNNDQKVERCLIDLEQIYGKEIVDQIRREKEESFSWSWEIQYGYNGAFKLNDPGQYDDQWALFRQSECPEKPVFLAGEGVSWAGGWIEGALHSGLKAARGVIKRLGGT